MSNVIRRVFSQKLAKRYYITRDLNSPIGDLPCFTLAECNYIKEKNLSVEELEWAYKMKLKDPLYCLVPREKPLPVGTIIPKDKTISDRVEEAMLECIASIQPEISFFDEPEEASVKVYTETDWEEINKTAKWMIKQKFLIDMSFAGFDKYEYKKKRMQALTKRK